MLRRKPISILLAVAALALFFAGGSAMAAGEFAPTPIQTEIPIPIAEQVQGYSEGKVADVANYIGVMYQFVISIIGLVAAIMMIIGGFEYLTSAGDSGKIGKAKKRITDALIGLTLALSAYALLNTINPALLQFKPLSGSLNPVATELALLPWCEEISAKGVAVTKSGNGTNCGNIGQFQQDGNTLYCMYQGSCRIGREKRDSFDQVSTCMQKAQLNTKTVKDAVTKDKNVSLGVCLPCMYITNSIAHELGYGLEDACYAWMQTVNDIRTKDDPNQKLWSYCGAAEKFPSCVQADINCENVNDNDPDAISDGGCADAHACGCGGYDDSPEPAWSSSDHTLAEYERGSRWDIQGNEQLDALTDHLGAVCALNPCQNFRDTRVTEEITAFNGLIRISQQSFKNSCSGPGVSKYVKGLRVFTSDCRNR